MERESGFYWVKYFDEWIVAEYCASGSSRDAMNWLIHGHPQCFYDNKFEEIGERIERKESE